VDRARAGPRRASSFGPGRGRSTLITSAPRVRPRNLPRRTGRPARASGPGRRTPCNGNSRSANPPVGFPVGFPSRFEPGALVILGNVHSEAVRPKPTAHGHPPDRRGRSCTRSEHSLKVYEESGPTRSPPAEFTPCATKFLLLAARTRPSAPAATTRRNGLRQRLLSGFNPHHSVRAYSSFAEAAVAPASRVPRSD